MSNIFNTLKNDLYKIDELSVDLEFYRWIPNNRSNKTEIIFKELQKCKIIEICQKFEDNSIKINIKYSFDRDGTTEIRETQVFGLLEYAYGNIESLPNSIVRNNNSDFIATGFAGSHFHFFKVSSYNKGVINNPKGKIELSGGKKTKNKK
jgi:hypothetical protein